MTPKEILDHVDREGAFRLMQLERTITYATVTMTHARVIMVTTLAAGLAATWLVKVDPGLAAALVVAAPAVTAVVFMLKASYHGFLVKRAYKKLPYYDRQKVDEIYEERQEWDKTHKELE